MIISTHLRIGNYFISGGGGYCEKGELQVVNTISKTGVNEWRDMGASGSDTPLPIELNDEWLEKFGFEKVNDGFENGIRIEYVPEMDCYWLETNNEVQTSPIKFVHQLQNLYFALQGKELTKT